MQVQETELYLTKIPLTCIDIFSQNIVLPIVSCKKYYLCDDLLQVAKKYTLKKNSNVTITRKYRFLRFWIIMDGKELGRGEEF